MPVNHEPTPVAHTQSTDRNEEFQLALEQYMDSYRAAQLGRRQPPRGRLSLLGQWNGGRWMLTKSSVAV